MTDNKKDPENPKRRDFLNTAAGTMVGCGVAAAAWPFISSMNPSKDVLAKSTTEINLEGISPGSMKTVEWQGKPVFILHRSDEQIERMSASQGGKDPQSDSARVLNPAWLVVIGVCTHLGCVPSRKKEGWFCPCHGSSYDDSGRVLTGPAPSNLELPPYQFIANNKIIIGKTEA